MVQHIFVAYFSGTGGTAKAAKCLAAALEARGASVTLREITKGAGPQSGGEDYLALLFPAHAYNAPLPVYRWLEALKAVSGTRAAVVSVTRKGNVSPNTACRRSAVARLRKKGYDVIYEDCIVMPCNALIHTPAGAAARLLKALPKKMDAIAQDMLAGRRKALKSKLRDRIYSRVGEAEKPAARLFGRTFYADVSCAGCGRCAGSCPMGNIRMEGGKPVFGSDCCLCLKCVYGCPARAINLRYFRSIVFKEGYDLNAMEKAPADESEALPGSRRWKGLREYLEAAERTDKI